MKSFLVLVLVVNIATKASAQASLPVMETGGQPMPDVWIDKDTGHKVMKLTRRDGMNASFYFHNNPFIGNEMVFCGGDKPFSGNDMLHNSAAQIRRQMYAVNLNTLQIRQLTNEPFNVRTEIVCPKTHELFYQRGDTVYALNTDRMERRIITVMPEALRGNIITVNADGTMLAGKLDDPKEREILREHPKKHEFFNLIFQARLKKTIFTLDTKTGVVDTIYSERAWLNHLQFSPTDPTLLMFCHEGPWHEVDRIWTIDVVKRDKPKLIHKRTMYREIAGHEWWGADGKHIYFDLQKPRGETFFVGKVNVYTGVEEDFELQRNEWSVHFVSSWDEQTLAGDGGSKTSVAHSPEGQWIYFFEYDGNRLKSTKLVNMKNHNYNLEPNIHYSPDQKWIIFRANFEGSENVYAVELSPYTPYTSQMPMCRAFERGV